MAESHGWSIDIGSTRVGWFAPLRVTGVRVHGESMWCKLHVDQISSDFTFSDLLFGSGDSAGHWVITGVGLHFNIDADRRSSVRDYLDQLSIGDSGGALPEGRIQIRDLSMSVTDAATKEQWQLTKSHAEINLHHETWDTEFSGDITEPGGRSGSFQGSTSAVLPSPNGVARIKSLPQVKSSAIIASDNPSWQCEIESKTLPLSLFTLAVGPQSLAATTVPWVLIGDATGTLRLAGRGDGTINADVDHFEFWNLRATDPVHPARSSRIDTPR